MNEKQLNKKLRREAIRAQNNSSRKLSMIEAIKLVKSQRAG